MNNTPVFVKIEEYKDLLDIMNLTEEKLKKAQELLEKIKTLKGQEDAALETWKQELKNVDSRVSEIGKRLARQM